MITSCFYQYIAIFWTWILLWRERIEWRSIYWSRKLKSLNVPCLSFIKMKRSLDFKKKIDQSYFICQSLLFVSSNNKQHMNHSTQKRIILWAGSIWQCWYRNPGIFDDVGCWYREHSTMLIWRARSIWRCHLGKMIGT